MIIGSDAEGRRDAQDRGPLGLAPVTIRRSFDVLSAALAVAVLGGWWESELSLDALWVLLAGGAFVFGLRASLTRITLGALLTVLSLPLEALRSPDFSLNLFDLVDWLLLVVIALIVAFMADRVTSTARHYADLYRQASDRLVAAHEEERLRLARDVHDGIGQTLTAAVLTLQAAEGALGADASAGQAGVRSAISRALSLNGLALEEARGVAARLRPVRIREVGLGAAIHELADAAGRPVEVRFPPTVLPEGLLAPEREIDAFRVVQEALGNATRHSGASRIWIDALVRRGRVRLQVGDDGIGSDPAARSRGLGLAGMRERAEILGGQLQVRSRPGRGTTVALDFPLVSGRGRRATRPPAEAAGQAAHPAAPNLP
jgi:signal transduction histidine kinase